MTTLEQELQEQEKQRKQISASDLNKKQRASLKHIIHWLRKHEGYNGVTSVRFKLEEVYGNQYVTVTTFRSDCEPSSPRALFSDWHIHAKLGPRGGIEIYSSQCGMSDVWKPSCLAKHLHCSYYSF